MDLAAEEVLRIIGYTVATHVMCRATLSRGNGRSEEVLTSDIADILRVFDVIPHYLQCKHSDYQIDLRISDLTKPTESKIGGDFVIVICAHDPSTKLKTPYIRKVILVQAKREDYQSGGKLYAKSTNHQRHAQNMAKCVGTANAFFAYYHSDNILAQAQVAHSSLPSWTVPKFYFATPEDGNSYFFCKHPKLKFSTFIEPSSFRAFILKNLKQWTLPPGYEYGVVLDGISQFLSTQNNVPLPTPSTVISKGTPLHEFFIQLANCSIGENIVSNSEFNNRIRETIGVIRIDEEIQFSPSFALLLRFGRLELPEVPEALTDV